MTCEGCANKIKKSVSQVEGAELISFDISAGEIEITFDETKEVFHDESSGYGKLKLRK